MWISADISLSSKEIFKAYFDGKVHEVKQLSGEGSAFQDLSARLKFQSGRFVKLKKQDEYVHAECSDYFLETLGENISADGLECWQGRKSNDDMYESFFAYNKQSGMHYFYILD